MAQFHKRGWVDLGMYASLSAYDKLYQVLYLFDSHTVSVILTVCSVRLMVSTDW